MNLAQMYSLANAKSSYSRPDAEIYAALDQAGLFVYAAVLKEYSGFFIKFDTTSLVLVPGTQAYNLPPDLTQIVHLAERLNVTLDWNEMSPIKLSDAVDNIQQATGWDSFSSYYGDSQFGYYGPYLLSQATSVTQTLQVQQIQVSPGIDQTRMCELVYSAKWLPINDSSSLVMMPDEGTHAMLNYAIAELLRSNDDSLAQNYEAQGDKQLSSFLTWVRNRQIQQGPTIKAYGPGW